MGAWARMVTQDFSHKEAQNIQKGPISTYSALLSHVVIVNAIEYAASRHYSGGGN